METETVSLGSSSRVIGEKRESFNALVIAYSRRPEWSSIALKVPIQPLSLLSLPIFQVTNNGLNDDVNKSKQNKTKC